ncbi:GNAT family N-acetyltransferase [Leisingera sp. ANG-S5]|uniref:GNAT family N-acetyltransferase n=1 Tax=Leisingera sp. ANG-S5 TaxID=1577901 RepID=UPI00057E6920|nr:GNAT family N-acetyltransferase [Leisingera sp. ANG-S5]KIC32589.1 GNAT family acetyltransferase [Leisingera sp. ANG-S5]
MTTAPTISTARLTLRHHVMSDFAPLHDVLGSDRARYMGGPFSLKDSWQTVAAEVGSWSLLGHGSWAIERADDGALVGQVGINKPAHYPEAEIGWTLCSGFEGNGYITEAAAAALLWAWSEMGASSLVSYITPGNSRSVSVAERLGGKPDLAAPLPLGETSEDTIVYRHFAPDCDGGMEAYA